MTWKYVPHKIFLWFSLLDTFQMENPSDATLASLSNLKSCSNIIGALLKGINNEVSVK